MSHVATVDIEVRDLDSLAAACSRVGLELVRNQNTYKWYGESVGDTPIPAGFTAEDLGNCEHAIRVPGQAALEKHRQAYEIGVVRRRDGRPGFTLMYDAFGTHGRALEALAGAGCAKLKQAYAAIVSAKTARLRGHQVTERLRADGSIELTLR